VEFKVNIVFGMIRILMELAKMRPVDGAARISTTLRHMYTIEKTNNQALDCNSSPFVTTACRNASVMPENQYIQRSRSVFLTRKVNHILSSNLWERRD
jgi:hypothetical protein